MATFNSLFKKHKHDQTIHVSLKCQRTYAHGLQAKNVTKSHTLAHVPSINTKK